MKFYNLFRFGIISLLKALFFGKKEKREFLKNRLAQRFDELPEGDYIWLHCASVGEINLSETLVRLLLEDRNKKFLFTCVTDTGMQLAREKYRDCDRVAIRYFPLDDEELIENALSKMDSCLLLLIETELWPNLITCVHRRANTAVALINGRISDRSFGRYRIIKFFLRKILDKIDCYYMQSLQDAERIIRLGAKPDRVFPLGNIKFDVRRDPVPEEILEKYREILAPEGRKILVAGSTRRGENEVVLDAFGMLSDTLLVIAPRHPENTGKIEGIIGKKGYSCERFSVLEKEPETGKSCDVVLIDSIGKLRILYALCDLAFVGGTLVNIGGHSLLEPLCYGKKPLFGPYLQNVRDISREILSRHIGCLVRNAAEFAEAAGKILAADAAETEKAIDAFFEAHKDITRKIVDGLRTIPLGGDQHGKNCS